MELKGSKTEKNLWAAFNAESAAKIEIELVERLSSLLPPQEVSVKRLIVLAARANKKVIRLLQARR